MREWLSPSLDLSLICSGADMPSFILSVCSASRSTLALSTEGLVSGSDLSIGQCPSTPATLSGAPLRKSRSLATFFGRLGSLLRG